MKIVVCSSFLLVLFNATIPAQTPDQFSPLIVRQTISSSGSSSEISFEGREYLVQESIGQASPIGSTQLTGKHFIQGFIQPWVLTKILTPETPVDLAVTIFPNPFIEFINIRFDTLPMTDVNVSVFDILGSEVSRITYASQMQLSIELVGLTYGYYFLKVETDKSQHIEKILKSN